MTFRHWLRSVATPTLLICSLLNTCSPAQPPPAAAFNRPNILHQSVSLTHCVSERVITAKLHRRRRLSARTGRDGQIFMDSREGEPGKNMLEAESRNQGLLSKVSAVRLQFYGSSAETVLRCRRGHVTAEQIHKPEA